MREKLNSLLASEKYQEFVNRYLNGDYNVFFDLLKKEGLLYDYSDELMDTVGKEYIEYTYKQNPQKTIKVILDFYPDVIQKGNKYYLRLDDKEDLKIFFKSDDGGRDLSSKDVVQYTFDDSYEPFYNTVYDIYDNLISELDDKNLILLSKLMSKDFKGKRIYPFTNYLKNIAEDQGHSEYVSLDDYEDVLDILENDSDSTESLLDVSEYGGELNHIYDLAYNDVYKEEIYDNVYSELKELLETDVIGDWSSKKVKSADGKIRTLHYYDVDITNFVPYLFESLFEDPYFDNDFEYLSYFENLLEYAISQEIIEGGSANNRNYDYVDPTRIMEKVNDYFRDEYS